MSDDRTQPGDQPSTEPVGSGDPRGPGTPSDPSAPSQWPAPPEPGAPPPWPAPSDAAGPPQWPAPPPVEQPAPGAVHPLDVGRAFSVGWSLFRFRWRALIGAGLLVMVPVYIVQALLTVYAADAFDRWGAAVQTAVRAALNEGRQIELADLPAFPFAAMLASLGSGVLISLAGVVVAAVLVYIIGWTYGGGRPTVGAALSRTATRLPGLLGAAFLVGTFILLVVLGGIVLTIALMAAANFQPGAVVLFAFIVIVSTFAVVVFLSVRWQFYVQAIMLEGAGAVASLGRSWRLVSGASWRVLGYLLLLLVVLFLVGLVAGVLTLIVFGFEMNFATGQPAYSPARAAGQVIVPGLLSLLVMPFYMAVMTLLYYDLRWRGAEQIGPPPA